jgi:Mrp family chromosome partitioning ATPase
MSKNFELLKRIGKDDFFNPPEESGPRPRRVSSPVPLKKEPPDAEITSLVQRLFSQTGSGHKVVSFSGITRDDRSSWICARAGQALAEQAENSVCIVEANLRSPQLHRHLAAANQIGLADSFTVAGPIRNFAQPICGNCWLIPSGSVKLGFLPSRERYRQRFSELRDAFDYILISAPALSREAEAASLGQLADGVVLIVEADQSRRDTVRRAKEQLETAHVRLLGAVLDQRTFPIPEKIYQKL